LYQQLNHYLDGLKNSSDQISYDKSLIILNKKCVRIYLVAEVESRSISLQVEVFPLLNSHSIRNSKTPCNLHRFLKSYITNLEYLLNLYKSGFELFFIEKEGIWFVKKILDRKPDEEFTKLILPPEENPI
jgi:hypothetical protein